LLQTKVLLAAEEAKKAKRALADVTNENQPGPRKRRKAISAESEADAEEVSMVARRFTIMNSFWLHEERQTFRTQVDEQYDHLQRFENTTSKIQGQLTEILDVLPSRFKDLMGDHAVWLSQTVSTL
jgi:hypothetical protein